MKSLRIIVVNYVVIALMFAMFSIVPHKAEASVLFFNTRIDYGVGGWPILNSKLN